ncbi:unnamed protein product [Ambrosiozyma monospora]|uniref:Unnamed protein product n=1 Tax=Ambrosiozyma monospora TaxID=43982 RepID=A0ACB5T690_AMBMO|nr:unnamed protein product [Ambrosiozyma monospora]
MISSTPNSNLQVMIPNKTCKSCNLPIGVDSSKSSISGNIYHHECIKCIHCKKQLEPNQRCCVPEPGIFICLNCSVPCYSCHRVIDYDETAVVVGPTSASGSDGQGNGQAGSDCVVYHEQCFKCKVCDISLLKEIKYGRLKRGLVCMTCLSLIQRKKNTGGTAIKT